MLHSLSKRLETLRSRDKQSGFTLIELLIVIVILGILAAVVVFSVQGITDKGSQSACAADVTTVTTAVEAYYAQGNPASYPADEAAAKTALIPKFLHGPWPSEVSYALTAGQPVITGTGC